MKLSDVWMIFVCLALTMYVVLDGYDLGIGVLTLLDRDERRRREMHELVSWYWDGNESWLVFLALTVWSGLPLVLGIALPALYVPLILMLWSLIARGVALEMIEQHKGWHPFWGKVFGVGSLLAAFCQGAAFGGVVAGFNVNGSDFRGRAVHVPAPRLRRPHRPDRRRALPARRLRIPLPQERWRHAAAAARTGRLAAVALAVGTAASWLLASSAGPVVLHPGASARLPVWIVGGVVLGAGLAFAMRSFSADPRARHSDAAPGLATLAVYGGGLLVARGLLYPHVVPPHITVHEAASPHTTLLFATIAAIVFVPLYLTCQLYGYRVFRGKLNVERKARTT